MKAADITTLVKATKLKIDRDPIAQAHLERHHFEMQFDWFLDQFSQVARSMRIEASDEMDAGDIADAIEAIEGWTIEVDEDDYMASAVKVETRIVLESELTAFLKGIHIEKKYRAVLERDTGNRVTLTIEQPIDGEWHPTGGTWYLSTLLAYRTEDSDEVYIDHGQGWKVSGMRAALAEAKEKA